MEDTGSAFQSMAMEILAGQGLNEVDYEELQWHILLKYISNIYLDFLNFYLIREKDVCHQNVESQNTNWETTISRVSQRQALLLQVEVIPKTYFSPAPQEL